MNFFCCDHKCILVSSDKTIECDTNECHIGSSPKSLGNIKVFDNNDGFIVSKRTCPNLYETLRSMTDVDGYIALHDSEDK